MKGGKERNRRVVQSNNLPEVGEIQPARYMKFEGPQIEISETCYDEDNQALKRQRKNFESSKRKKTHHRQGHPGKVISRFLTRNPVDQKRVGFTFKELKTNQPTTEKQTANQECFPQSPLKFLFYVCHLLSSRAFCQVYWTLC